MIESPRFLRSVLDSITAHIAVVDPRGIIVFANQAWLDFAKDNGFLGEGNWVGVDYLAACNRALAAGDEYAAKAVRGIAEVMEGTQDTFQFEYPCHSPKRRRWFVMRVSSFDFEGSLHFVVAHQDITERKLAEQRVLDLVRIDGLTDVYNRRYFDEFLDAEWRRCLRQGQPISLALLDIDHFKLLNDHYGHQHGDDCLRQIGEVLKRFGKRPGDLCARYGGEEFALVFGNTTIEGALCVVNKIVAAIDGLAIPHKVSPTKPTISVSIGLATLLPKPALTTAMLVESADRLLYDAKARGRNLVVFSSEL